MRSIFLDPASSFAVPRSRRDCTFPAVTQPPDPVRRSLEKGCSGVGPLEIFEAFEVCSFPGAVYARVSVRFVSFCVLRPGNPTDFDTAATLQGYHGPRDCFARDRSPVSFLRSRSTGRAVGERARARHLAEGENNTARARSCLRDSRSVEIKHNQGRERHRAPSSAIERDVSSLFLLFSFSALFSPFPLFAVFAKWYRGPTKCYALNVVSFFTRSDPLSLITTL